MSDYRYHLQRSSVHFAFECLWWLNDLMMIRKYFFGFRAQATLLVVLDIYQHLLWPFWALAMLAFMFYDLNFYGNLCLFIYLFHWLKYFMWASEPSCVSTQTIVYSSGSWSHRINDSICYFFNGLCQLLLIFAVVWCLLLIGDRFTTLYDQLVDRLAWKCTVDYLLCLWQTEFVD